MPLSIPLQTLVDSRSPAMPPRVVYLLAEHLDAALAAGEDLLALAFEVPIACGAVDAETVAEQAAALSAFVNRLETFELALVSRVLAARKRAGELKRLDVRFRPMAGLFEGGTAALLDAAAELGNLDERQLHVAGCPLAYLRRTCLIGEDAASLSGITRVKPGDAFRICGRIELGPLLDLVAAFLDTLDLHFELFATPDGAEDPAKPGAEPGVAVSKTG